MFQNPNIYSHNQLYSVSSLYQVHIYMQKVDWGAFCELVYSLKLTKEIIYRMALIKGVVSKMVQTTLYTRVLVNTTKRMEKSPILRCTFIHHYLVFLLAHYTQN